MEFRLGKELAVDERDEVVAGEGGVGINLAVLALRRRPRFPAVRFIEGVGVALTVEGGFGGLVVFEGVEVFQEEQPRGLLSVIEFAGAAGVLPEDVVDVFKGLFEHGGDEEVGQRRRSNEALDHQARRLRTQRPFACSPRKIARRPMP